MYVVLRRGEPTKVGRANHWKHARTQLEEWLTYSPARLQRNRIFASSVKVPARRPFAR